MEEAQLSSFLLGWIWSDEDILEMIEVWGASLQPYACNFTKINTPLWVSFTFFKSYKWYQIAQRITYKNMTILP